MQRWEYKVVSFGDGRFTAGLNDYGRDGWELVSVASDVHAAPAAEEKGSRLPVPGALGKLEDAASRLSPQTPDPPASLTTLLWVLRRPLEADE